MVTGSIINFEPYTTPLNDPEIVLTNSKGSVTLGIDQNDKISQSTPGRKRWQAPYTVESGTGAYAGISGAGTSPRPRLAMDGDLNRMT